LQSFKAVELFFHDIGRFLNGFPLLGVERKRVEATVTSNDEDRKFLNSLGKSDSAVVVKVVEHVLGDGLDSLFTDDVFPYLAVVYHLHQIVRTVKLLFHQNSLLYILL
jgi:hypothetical protein